MSTPVLPVELQELIVETFWLSNLSSEDRLTFMTSAALVNSAWKSVFARVSSRDVHIPSPSYTHQLLQFIRGGSVVYNDKLMNPANRCRSLSFLIVGDDGRGGRGEMNRMAGAMSDLFYMVEGAKYLPNLRRVHIEYVDISPRALFDEFHLLSFPGQATNLDLSFTFTRAREVDEMERMDRIPWDLPGVAHLSLKGISESVIANVASASPQLREIWLDREPSDELKEEFSDVLVKIVQ